MIRLSLVKEKVLEAHLFIVNYLVLHWIIKVVEQQYNNSAYLGVELSNFTSDSCLESLCTYTPTFMLKKLLVLTSKSILP